MLKINNRGFTLVEVIVVLVLIGTITVIGLSKIDWAKKISQGMATTLISDFSDIETAYGLYLNDKNASPASLADATFVPVYLNVPKPPSGFDTSYGTNGFVFALRSGQASPNNGYYVATRVTVDNANDNKWLAITGAASQLPTSKFFYNTSVPSVTNMAAPAVSTTVYLTYWITRY